MIYETVRFSVPEGSRKACRAATRELVETLRDGMEEEVRSYLVLEGGKGERTHYIHLAVFEDVDAERAYESSDAFRIFHDLVHPVTLDGIEVSRQTVVDRISRREGAVPGG